MVGYVVPIHYILKAITAIPNCHCLLLTWHRKKNIALYDMGIYGDKETLEWFTLQYPKHSSYKLDMGKGCI